MKKLFIIFSAMAMLFSWVAASAAAYTYPTIILDGRQLSVAVPAIDASGRTMVPARAFFEELGAAVSWETDTRVVTISKPQKEIVLTIGETFALVDGVLTSLDTPAQVIDGRVVVPLRFVAEAIGASVSWDAENQAIDIKTAPPTGDGPAPHPVPGSVPGPGPVQGEPESNAPAAALPDGSKAPLTGPQAPQSMLHVWVPLAAAAALAGALLVRRLRGNPSGPAGMNAADDGRETPPPAAGLDVLDWEEADHLAESNHLVNWPGDIYAEAVRDTPAAADTGPGMGMGEAAAVADSMPAAGDSTGTADSRTCIPPAVHEVPAAGEAETRAEPESVEAYYHKGIGLMQRRDWAGARLALVYPSIAKYKDSEELGYYIEALEQYQVSIDPEAADPYWASVMADYYCRKIPEDYQGIFRDEIQELKNRCRSNLALHMQKLEMQD